MTDSMSQSWDARTRAHQNIRLKRLFMTQGSYSATLMVVVACCVAGVLAWRYALHYVLFVACLNGAFYLCFSRGWNLHLKDPNLTAEQMLLSIVPALYVMYYVGDPQARSAFLLLSLTPLLYGMLGLNTRRFLVVAVINFFAYLSLIALLLRFRPHQINDQGDTIQVVALAGAVLQMALLGGYIYELRIKLRNKNEALNKALATISEMAHRDELTGAYNRRHLMETLEHETSRCNRGAAAFSLCILDLDHFKRANDTHGHLAGDQVLKQVAGLIDNSIRQIDCLGRFGGEEFLLIMPQTSIEGAEKKVDRLRAAVGELRFPEIAPDFSVTLSAGVAQYRNGESVSQLIHRADEALYRAKGAGRDQVVCALPVVT